MARPTDYRESMCAAVVECGKRGESKTEIACALGIARATLYRWIDDHPEFRDAIKEAEDHSERWFHNAFRTMAVGGYDKPNATALIFLAKNQLPDTFRDRREVDVKAEVGVFEIDFTGYDEDDDEGSED